MTDTQTAVDGGPVTDSTMNNQAVASGAAAADATPPNDQVMSEPEAESANRELVEHMYRILQDGREEANELRSKLKWTYWLIVTLSTLLFLVGLALVSTPLWPGAEDRLMATLTAVGIGFVDFVGLFLFNPIARIQKLMGDISQITAMLSSYQIRVALRLVETDSDKRETMGAASLHIGEVAEETLHLIENFYERWLLPDLNRTPESGAGLTTEEAQGSEQG